MLKEFRDFVLRGNVVELAVAVVIGAAFGAVVTAFVASFITPLIAAIGGKPDFSGARVHDQRLAASPTARSSTRCSSFLIIAAVVFFFDRAAAEHADGAACSPEPAVDEVVRAVPGVPVGHPDRGAALRVLHGGGRDCLTSAAAYAPRRRTRSRCRASCARRPAARSPRRATCS